MKRSSQVRRRAILFILALAIGLVTTIFSGERRSWGKSLQAQDHAVVGKHSNEQGPSSKQTDSTQDGAPNFRERQKMSAAQSVNQCRSSDIEPPEASDTTFVADCSSDGDLDTGCTAGTLQIRLKIPRVITDADRDRLIAAGLLSRTARLTLPAYDVDSVKSSGCGCSSSAEPEFDRVTFNGKEVKNANGTAYLEGVCNAWRLNSFEIPIDLIEFADDLGENGTATPKENTITIEIDTKNQQKCWCTSVDWAALTIETQVRPIVMVHGILSKAETWKQAPSPDEPTAIDFAARFRQAGIPAVTFSLDPDEKVLRNLKSIEENAGTVAVEVDKARRRWGMEKVNLLCHSKGGLDSRHFVEYSEGVDKLVQLGTPNGGSPMADFVQTVAIGAIVLKPIKPFGPLLGASLNLLAGSAGRQLTTAHMLYYNWIHGHNPKVSYYSIAGDYFPDCDLFDLSRCSATRYGFGLVLGISGRGDTIVPIYSVHELSYARHNQFRTVGDNFQATHTGLTKSPIAFDLAWSYLTGPSQPVGQFAGQANSIRADQSLTTATGESADAVPSLSRTASTIGIIRQGQTQTQIVPIGEAKPTVVTLLYPDGDFDLTLISPSGQQFDPQMAANNGQVKFGESELLGSKIKSYTLPAPETGQWTAVVKAVRLDTQVNGEAGYVVNAWVEGSAIELAGTAANLNVKPGEGLELQAKLKQNGQPMTGATVMAQIALPDDSVQQLSLRDNGTGGDRTANDGIYSGTFTQTQQAGSYRIAYQATSGSGAMTAFSREALAIATVSRSCTSFTGSFRDYGVNTDGDGFYNHLAVDAGINVTAETVYRVIGVLTDARGNRHEAAFQNRLRAGQNTVTLKFDGEAIFRNGVDGPYQLAELRVAEEEEGSILPVDSRANVFQTRAYKAAEFQHSAIILTGKGSANGVDTNSNRLFDLLKVGAEVNLAASGSYTWSARLTDRTGKELGFYTKTQFLRSGINTLDFDFNGKPIGENGVDGPYYLRGLILFGAGASVTAEQVFTTGAFQASQFEGFKINNPVPAISRIAPTSVQAGNAQITLTVTGEMFVKDSQVLWNGTTRQTVFDSPTQLRATIPAADLANPATIPVSVYNPMPGGGASSTLPFVIQPRPVDNGDAEREPNETSAQATPLSLPGKRTGTVAVGDAAYWNVAYEDGTIDHLEDFFALTLNKSAKLELNLKAANAAADLDMFLFREDNGALSYVGYSLSGAGMDEQIVPPAALAPGRYLIAVSAFSGSSSYTLTAKSEGTTDAPLLSLNFNNTLYGGQGEAPIVATGIISYSPGISGPGLWLNFGAHLFYGSADNINATEGTVELWIKPNWNGNDSRHHYILQHGGAGGILIGKDSANNLRLILNRYGSAGGVEIDTGYGIADWQANRWYHVAFTWSNSQKVARIYINGVLRSSRTFNQSLPAINSAGLQIGGDNASSYLEAVIDELNIHRVALSAQEVAARYQNP